MSINLRLFDDSFKALTAFAPMKWQQRLYECFARNEIPSACDIPTGLGKTSVIAIWLIALAAQAQAGDVKLPRRLIYVVNRRTVVDQATDDAISFREAVKGAHSGPLHELRVALNALCVDPSDDASPIAISTLRGEFADNGDWFADPARPSIAVGTIDMHGSRFLFSGYGIGRSRRALHAGLIGQDSLIVHDEAHLTPAFGQLLRNAAEAQKSDRSPRPFRVLELSATQRNTAGKLGSTCDVRIFALTADEEQEAIVQRRIKAPKSLRLHTLEAEDVLPEKLATKALDYRSANARVLVYVRKPQHARAVGEALRKQLGNGGDARVGVLTGTIRGYERSRLDGSAFFRCFLADSKRQPLVESRFLVCTSAGEVGVNLDADHLVCDLTTLDSMVQRLGRVNRLGRDNENFTAWIDVFHAKGKQDTDYEKRRETTRQALNRLPSQGEHYNANPAALRALLDSGSTEEAFAPPPRVVPCTDVLLDNWALTSVTDVLPGRPPVEAWLHGMDNDNGPETAIAWRAEVPLLCEGARHNLVSEDDLRRFYRAHRIRPHERLHDRTGTIVDELKKVLARRPDDQVLTVEADGGVRISRLEELVTKQEERALWYSTVVLPIEADGLDNAGFLSGKVSDPVLDVADAPIPTTGRQVETAQTRMRLRIIAEKENDSWSARPVAAPDGVTGFREVKKLENALEELGDRLGVSVIERVALELDDDGEERRILISLASARSVESALDSSSAAERRQTLREHSAWTRAAARAIVDRLNIAAESPGLAEGIIAGAFCHDFGKDRPAWQRAIGNRDFGEALAKSGRRGFNNELCRGYRHEFGSLVEAADNTDFASHPERDLILHLIASHHGWARPHFRKEQWDWERTTRENNEAAAVETMRRYARLQKRFGRWGLAWLEAVLKSADVMATIHGEAVQEFSRREERAS